jgi:hypothetical protein
MVLDGAFRRRQPGVAASGTSAQAFGALGGVNARERWRVAVRRSLGRERDAEAPTWQPAYRPTADSIDIVWHRMGFCIAR